MDVDAFLSGQDKSSGFDFDKELTDYFNKQDVKPGEDFFKSIPGGMVEGITSLATMPRTSQDLGALISETAFGRHMPTPQQEGGSPLSRYLQAITDTFGMFTGVLPMGYSPSGQELTKDVEENITGPLYQPQGTTGEFGKTIGAFMPSAVGGPSTMLRAGLIPAIGSETAGQLTKGTRWEPFARIAGALSSPYAAEKFLPGARPIPGAQLRGENAPPSAAGLRESAIGTPDRGYPNVPAVRGGSQPEAFAYRPDVMPPHPGVKPETIDVPFEELNVPPNMAGMREPFPRSQTGYPGTPSPITPQGIDPDEILMPSGTRLWKTETERDWATRPSGPIAGQQPSDISPSTQGLPRPRTIYGEGRTPGSQTSLSDLRRVPEPYTPPSVPKPSPRAQANEPRTTTVGKQPTDVKVYGDFEVGTDTIMEHSLAGQKMVVPTGKIQELFLKPEKVLKSNPTPGQGPSKITTTEQVPYARFADGREVPLSQLKKVNAPKTSPEQVQNMLKSGKVIGKEKLDFENIDKVIDAIKKVRSVTGSTNLTYGLIKKHIPGISDSTLDQAAAKMTSSPNSVWNRGDKLITVKPAAQISRNTRDVHFDRVISELRGPKNQKYAYLRNIRSVIAASEGHTVSQSTLIKKLNDMIKQGKLKIYPENEPDAPLKLITDDILADTVFEDTPDYVMEFLGKKK